MTERIAVSPEAPPPAPQEQAGAPAAEYGRSTTPSGIGIESNQAAKLKTGDLLLVYRNRCWQVDPDDGRVTYLFTLHRSPELCFWTAIPDVDGAIYCTVSGQIVPDEPIQWARFGTQGDVLRVDYAEREVRSLLQLVDPAGIELLDGSRMLVCDFNDWATTGQIHVVDRHTGASQTLVDGGLLTEPMKAHLDSDGVLWVSNAIGLAYDGEIIRVDKDGQQTVAVPGHGEYSGVICSVYPSNRENELLGIVVDWPAMARSALFSLKKDTGAVENLLSTSPDRPGVFGQFFARHNDMVWLAEAYHNELLAFDLNSREVTKRIDISAITGPYLGIMHAWDFVESVARVPEGWPAG